MSDRVPGRGCDERSSESQCRRRYARTAVDRRDIRVKAATIITEVVMLADRFIVKNRFKLEGGVWYVFGVEV